MPSPAQGQGYPPTVSAAARSLRRAAIIAGVTLLGSACASRGGPFRGSTAGPAEGTIRVRIESANWSDLTVFVESRTGVRQRLGTVTTNRSAEYTVELADVGGERPLRFVAELIGSSDVLTTEEYLLRAGEVVVWRVGNFRGDSTVRVIRTPDAEARYRPDPRTPRRSTPVRPTPAPPAESAAAAASAGRGSPAGRRRP